MIMGMNPRANAVRVPNQQLNLLAPKSQTVPQYNLWSKPNLLIGIKLSLRQVATPEQPTNKNYIEVDGKKYVLVTKDERRKHRSCQLSHFPDIWNLTTYDTM